MSHPRLQTAAMASDDRQGFTTAKAILTAGQARHENSDDARKQTAAEAWAMILLIDAGLQDDPAKVTFGKSTIYVHPHKSNGVSPTVTAEPSPRSSPQFPHKTPEKSTKLSQSPGKPEPVPKWMEARLNTPSRSGRALPTVFEVPTEATSAVADPSGDEADADAALSRHVNRSLLFRKSVETIKRDLPPHLPLRTSLPHSHGLETVSTSPHTDEATIQAIVKVPPSHPSNSNLASGPCSSCGVIVPVTTLSMLKPCLHPLCRICINALLNAACHDPPPDKMECFLCQTEVEGFELPSLSSLGGVVAVANESSDVLSVQSKMQDDNDTGTDTKASSRVRVKLPVPERSPLRKLDWAASTHSTPSSTRTKGSSGTAFDSIWTTPSSTRSFSSFSSSPLGKGQDVERSIVEIGVVADDIIVQRKVQSANSSAAYPVVRVDNISWKLTVATVADWVPSRDMLPPKQLRPSPIHVLCTPDDGKTLNFAYIELKDLASARRLVRERGNGSSIAGRRGDRGDGGRIGGRPCSVALASTDELKKNIFGDHQQDLDGLCRQLCKLCSLTSPHVRKAPERPFLHLASILSHIDHVLPSSLVKSPKPSKTRLSVVERWDAVDRFLKAYEGAVEKASEEGMSEVVEMMVDTALASSAVDLAMKGRLLATAASGSAKSASGGLDDHPPLEAVPLGDLAQGLDLGA